MGWHVLSSTNFDFDRFDRERQADRLPRHLLPTLAERLRAHIHQPGGDAPPPSPVDRLGSKIFGQPMHWELARRVLGELRRGDSVYAAGCDAGVPLALLSALRRRGVSFAIPFIDIKRRRTRWVGWLLVLLRVRLLVIVSTSQQAAAANRTFARFANDILIIEGQTDTRFFRPPDERAPSDPPLVASSGVEQRDYSTLAAALGDIDLEVVVSYVSPNLTNKTQHRLPATTPPNMTLRHFEFVELRSLYQRAEVFILPLLENRYSAGLSALFEAIACGAPVVASSTDGAIEDLIADDLIVGVPVGDADALRAAVEKVLAEPEVARARADKARQVLLERYSAASYLNRLSAALEALAATAQRS